MLGLKGAGRLLGALSCLRSLPGDVAVLPTLDDVDSCHNGDGRRFCYMHLSLDPLPASGSVGLCLATECSIPQLTDLFSLICALPSCSLLQALPPDASAAAELCGPLQRTICGPIDRTQMEHDLDLTCVDASSSHRRRLASDMDDARNNDNMFVDGLKHLFWDELTKVLKDLKSKYWQDGLAGDWSELKDALAKVFHDATAGGELDTGLLELERAFNAIGGDVAAATEELATDLFDFDNTLLADFWNDFVRDARDAESLKALTEALEHDFRRSIERHKMKVQGRVQNITDHLTDWIRTERAKFLNDSRVVKALDKLQTDIRHLDGDVKDSVRRDMDDALDRMRDLVHRAMHRGGAVTEQTSTPATRLTHPAMVSPLDSVHEITATVWRLVDKLRKKDFEGAEVERDEAIDQLEKLAATVRAQFEDTLVAEFDSYVNTAKDTLNKWLHTNNTDSIDRSAIILMTRLSELTSFDKLHDKHTQPFSHSLESVVLAAEVFVDDLLTLTTRRVADVASDELLRRDITKLDRKVSALISAARTEYKMQYVNHWIDFKKKLELVLKKVESMWDNPRELEDMLQSMVKSLADFLKRIKDDHLQGMVDRLLQDHPFLKNVTDDRGRELVDNIMDKVIGPLIPAHPEPHRRLADTILSTFEGKPHSFSALSWLPFTLDILQHIKPRLDLWADTQISVEKRKEFHVSEEVMRSIAACGSSTFRNPKALLLSGHSVQSVGDYYGCLEEPNAQYCLVKGAGMISQGRCLNENSCSAERLATLSSFICRWVSEGRSCFELANIIPPDYCVFVKIVGCGIYDEVPSMNELPGILGMNVKHPHVDYWWSPDYSGPSFLSAITSLVNSSRFVNEVKLSQKLLFTNPESVWNQANVLHRSPVDDGALPYNISRVAQDLGYPILEHYCSNGRETYWTPGRLAVVAVLAFVFLLLPLSALYAGTLDSRERRGAHWNPITKILGAFHFIENYYIWSAPTEKLPTSAIHGMRVISMYWIILGHTLSSVFLTNALHNYMATIDLIHSSGMQLVMGAVFGVDTFFCFSGFLLGLKALPHHSPASDHQSAADNHHHHHHVLHNSGASSYHYHHHHHHGWGEIIWDTIKGFVRRWLRISPTYYLLLTIWIVMVPDLVSAPFYTAFSNTLKNNCRGSWQYHLLYVDNLQGDVDTCMGWSWYLAVDMQLFVLGLLLTRLYYHSKKAFLHTWIIFFAGASLWCFVDQLQNHYTLGQMSLSVVGDVTLDTDIHTATQKQLNYIRPYPRMMGYLTALWLGLWMRSHNILQGDTKKHDSSAPTVGETPAPGLAPRTGEHCTPLLERGNDVEQLASPWLESEEKNCKVTDTPRQADTAQFLRSRHRHSDQEETRVQEKKCVHTLCSKQFWQHYAILGHVLALLQMFSIIYLPYLNYVKFPDVLPYFVTVIYNIYARLIWVACVLWFLITCMAVHAGVCNDRLSRTVYKLLSNAFFAHLAPLVYGSYLLHMGLQTAYYAHVPTTAYISLADGFHESLAWAPFTFACAFVLYLAIELPIARVMNAGVA